MNIESNLIKLINNLKFDLTNIEKVKLMKTLLNKIEEKYRNKLNIPKNLGYILITFWINLEVQIENYDEPFKDEIIDIYSEYIFDIIADFPYLTEEDFNTINCKADKIMLNFFNLTMDILLYLRYWKGIDNNKIDSLNILLKEVDLLYKNKNYISKKFVNCFLSFFNCIDINFSYYKEDKYLYINIINNLFYKVCNILCEDIC